MRHIRQVDSKEHTVLMMQVENEVGIRDDSRDRSPTANAAFVQPVPKDLMNYLLLHKSTLTPELLEVLTANGNKTAGTWEKVFGPGKPASVCDESTLVDGRWVPGRRLNGDETDHNCRWQNMRSFGIYRYTVFQRE